MRCQVATVFSFTHPMIVQLVRAFRTPAGNVAYCEEALASVSPLLIFPAVKVGLLTSVAWRAWTLESAAMAPAVSLNLRWRNRVLELAEASALIADSLAAVSIADTT